MAYTLNASGEAPAGAICLTELASGSGVGGIASRLRCMRWGLLGEGERKSVEPIAARACGDPALCRAYTERLLNFVTESDWRDPPVREYAARFGVEAMTSRSRSRRGSSTAGLQGHGATWRSFLQGHGATPFAG